MNPSPEAEAWIEARKDGLSIRVLVQPRASRSESAGIQDGRLKIRLKAPPVKGAANKELIAFLAKALGVSKGSVTVTSGQSSRRKTVSVEGVAVLDAMEMLGVSR